MGLEEDKYTSKDDWHRGRKKRPLRKIERRKSDDEQKVQNLVIKRTLTKRSCVAKLTQNWIIVRVWETAHAAHAPSPYFAALRYIKKPPSFPECCFEN